VAVSWNQPVDSNKPDIINRDNKQGTCMSVDVAIGGDRNVIKREAEKILKYKELTAEIQRMWSVKGKSNAGNNSGRLEPFQNHFDNT
jgi:hypothetical protein